jgi:hypothetical protein
MAMPVRRYLPVSVDRLLQAKTLMIAATPPTIVDYLDKELPFWGKSILSNSRLPYYNDRIVG